MNRAKFLRAGVAAIALVASGSPIAWAGWPSLGKCEQPPCEVIYVKKKVPAKHKMKWCQEPPDGMIIQSIGALLKSQIAVDIDPGQMRSALQQRESRARKEDELKKLQEDLEALKKQLQELSAALEQEDTTE